MAAELRQRARRCFGSPTTQDDFLEMGLTVEATLIRVPTPLTPVEV